MYYNNGGMKTPRSLGSSGHIQKNIAYYKEQARRELPPVEKAIEKSVVSNFRTSQLQLHVEKKQFIQAIFEKVKEFVEQHQLTLDVMSLTLDYVAKLEEEAKIKLKVEVQEGEIV